MSENQKKSIIVRIVKVLFPLMLIAAGGVAWAYFKATAPTIERTVPQPQVTAVQIESVKQSEARTAISAMGTVVPSREVTLKARVSGTVQAVASDFVPGGCIPDGAELVSLDPSDHKIAVQKAKSALADARAALAIEQGSQNIAREELRLLSESSSETIPKTDLALRKPQLQQAQAAVSGAEADLRQARLDLERTVVRSPFNALIIDRNVNIGTYVGAGDTLATIVGTDEFWVEAVVPLDQLDLIDFGYAGGCPAIVRSQSGNGQWEGRVVRVAGKLNESSRMATVIVAVANPLGRADLSPSHLMPSHLMIDDYVNVEITGRNLSNIIELPRTALQDGNTVWVYSNNSSLDIRPVTLAWKSADKVYIQSGLKPGEQVVMSDLSAPVQGMALQITGTATNANNKERKES